MSTCVAKFSQDRGQPRPPAALTAGAPSRTRLLGSPPQRCSGRLSFLFVGARAASELHVSRSRPTAEWSRRRRCLSPREPRSLRLSAFRTLATVAASGAELPPIDSIEAMPVMLNGELADLPPEPGVYAVYSPEMKLQYIGISRQVRNASLCSPGVSCASRSIDVLTKQ